MVPRVGSAQKNVEFAHIVVGKGNTARLALSTWGFVPRSPSESYKWYTTQDHFLPPFFPDPGPLCLQDAQ